MRILAAATLLRRLHGWWATAAASVLLAVLAIGLPACGDSATAREQCPVGQVDCGDGCVDLEVDPRHCGGCGLPCAPDQQCHSGACTAPCEDECDAAGDRECFGDGWRQCGEHDSIDVCLEWSAVEPCAHGYLCDAASVTCREACGDFCDPFSVVLLPDTQYYASKQPNDENNTYRKQMQWILDHRAADNIQFVIHLGDITHNNTPEQWAVASDAHAMLDAAGLPYSVATGNHDYLTSAGFGRGQSLLDQYFGPDRFQGRPWYGGSLGGSNANNYMTFERGPMRFLVLSLEYAPRKDALCWADEIIASHPTHRVIVATHCYLTHDGGYGANCPDSSYQAIGSDGATVWEELIRRHSNIFMVVSGHIGDSETVVSQGHAGNDVHQLLVDYQFEAACAASDPLACSDHCRAGTYTGNGWLRQLVFYPREHRIHSQTHTVLQDDPAVFPEGEPMLFCSELNQSGRDWYAADPLAEDHEFDLPYDLAVGPDYEWSDGDRAAFLDRTVNSVGAGQQLDPQVAIAPDGSFIVAWEDDSSSADGAGNHDIFLRGFGPGGCETLADLQVNPGGQGQQQAPAVAVDGQGNIVAVWQDDSDGNGSFQIHARGLYADGSERFAARTVNTVAAGQQRRPTVAAAPDGRFVVAWEDDPDGDGAFQVTMRGFAADGGERFSSRSVHSDGLGHRVAPAVGLDVGARFVVVWQDDSDDNGVYQIHARGFDAAGSERFGRLTVNSQAAGQQRSPSVGVSSAGEFAVAWEDDSDGDGSYRIMARGFAADGTNRLDDFTVSDTAGHHVDPALTMAPDGAFAVSWQDDSDGNGSYQIAARAFFADGSERLAEWTVNRVGSGQQLAPHVAENAAGALVVSWQDDMDGNGIFQILARGHDAP